MSKDKHVTLLKPVDLSIEGIISTLLAMIM